VDDFDIPQKLADSAERVVDRGLREGRRREPGVDKSRSPKACPGAPSSNRSTFGCAWGIVRS
jgi:hypothetical protein